MKKKAPKSMRFGSSCCHKQCKAVGNLTRHYVCMECNKTCDLVEYKKEGTIKKDKQIKSRGKYAK